MPARTVRTTLALPADLLAAADRAVQAGKARSRNEFVANALRRELAVQERASIDAAFMGMAKDYDFQQEAIAVAEPFAMSDWEALRIAESGK